MAKRKEKTELELIIGDLQVEQTRLNVASTLGPDHNRIAVENLRALRERLARFVQRLESTQGMGHS